MESLDDSFLYDVQQSVFFSQNGEMQDFLSSPDLSSPDRTSSPNNAPTTPPCFDSSGVSVILSHKPRGSKGVWQRVVNNEKLRVTKGKGKRLKLEVKIPDGVEYSSSTTQILLGTLDGELPSYSTEGFTVEVAKVVGGVLEAEVKLMKMGKNLQFLAQFVNVQGEVFAGRSVIFITHNSGTPAVVNPKPLSNNIEVARKTSSSPESSTFEISTMPLADPKKRRKESDEQDIVTVVPGPLHVKGEVLAQSFVQFSDLRLKTNVAELVDALQIITALQGKTYSWKNNDVLAADEKGGRRVIGLIAQEVQKVLPEVVHQDPETGYLSVSYAEILPVVIEAFKEFLTEYKADKEDIHEKLENIRDKFDQFSNQSGANQSELMKEQLKKLVDFLQQNSSKIRLVRKKPAQKPTWRDLFMFCKISQIVFSVIFLLSLFMVITGLALLLTNIPQDTPTAQPAQNKSISNSQLYSSNGQRHEKGNEEGHQNDHGWQRHGKNSVGDVKNSQHFLGVTDDGDITNTFEDPGDNEDLNPNELKLIFGIVLFFSGLVGMAVSAFGLCCCSAWMCKRTYSYQKIPII